jgi:general stress protein YciG
MPRPNPFDSRLEHYRLPEEDNYDNARLRRSKRMKEIGKVGGSRSSGGWLKGNKQAAREIGAKGGSKSRPPISNFVMYKGKKTPVVEVAKLTGQNYHSLLNRARKNGELI